MRIATYNIENLFSRPKIMNLESWNSGREVLNDYKNLVNLISADNYSLAAKEKMLELLEKNGLLSSGNGPYIKLVEVRDKLIKRPKNSTPEISATGRMDWVGWLELKTELVNAVATENTARVINLIDADILGVVEVENRIVLERFNEFMLPRVGADQYSQTMVIDGNDDRGIDVGIMLRDGFNIVDIRTHIFDEDNKGIIFSRDCPEFLIQTPSGNHLLVLVNHFKSKGFGSKNSSDEKRLRQSLRVAEIYEVRKKEFDFIVVMGDLNDTPDSDSLAPLLLNTDLNDITVHENFVSDGRPGTYANGTKSNKIDYLLLSPKLFERVTSGRIERHGVWGGKNGTLFPHIPEITKAQEAASDHAALIAEIDI
jgi:endonuclease/exonuclease/phosphatase family metal-dependent hydrolase